MADPHRTYNAATTFVDEPLARGWGPRVAFCADGRRVTYREFAEMTNRAGNALRDLGVEMEQRVLLLLLDSPEFAATFFGAIKIGAVAVPVSTMMRSEEYAYCLNDSRARVLIVHELLLPAIEPIRGRVPHLQHILVVREASSPGQAGQARDLRFDDVMARTSSALEPAATGSDDAAFWLYTSGSTGPPKGVVHLQRDMLYCADTAAKHVFGYTPDDIAFSVSKLYFAYGLGNALKNGQEPSAVLASELQAFVRARLAPYKVPRWVEFVDELPKTATGKIQRFRLRGAAQGPRG